MTQRVLVDFSPTKDDDPFSLGGLTSYIVDGSILDTQNELIISGKQSLLGKFKVNTPILDQAVFDRFGSATSASAMTPTFEFEIKDCSIGSTLNTVK